MSYLVMDKVAKRFHNHVVVDNFSLSVKEGQLVALVGPSGSGKTTILRMIAGLLVPDAGTIVLNGVNITNVAPNRRGIGLVFQSYALFPHMTCWDNIAYPLRLRKRSREDTKKRVGDLVELIGIHDPHRLPFQLSGGEQQRVALARAIATQPRLILLDEPFSALDAKVKLTIRREFRRLHHQLGTTMILVTHDQEEAFSMADLVGVLSKNGCLEQFATPEEIYYRPASMYVSTFVGTTNALRLESVDLDSASGIWHGFRVPLFKESLHRDSDGSYVLFVRPECMAFTDDEQDVPARLVNKYFYGSVVRMAIDVEGEEVIVDIPFSQAGKFVVGDCVHFRLLPAL